MRKTPTVLGVLSIIFGSLMAVLTGGGLLLRSFIQSASTNMFDLLPKNGRALNPTRFGEHVASFNAEIGPVQSAMSLTMVVMSLLLVVIGIGLYGRKDWARKAAMAWGGAALLYVGVMGYVQKTIIVPKTLEMQERMMADMGGAAGAEQRQQVQRMMASAGGALAVGGTIFFYTPFPIVLLALMARPRAREDFAA